MTDAFTRFCEAAERALPRWPEASDECALRLAELATSDALRQRVVAELEALTRRPTHNAALSISLHGWVLCGARGGAKLSLSRVAAGAGDDAGYLTDSPAHQLVAPCDGRAVRVQRYAPVGVDDPEVMRPDIRLEPREAFTLHHGEGAAVAPREVIDLLPEAEPRHLLIFDGPRRFTQQWVYERQSLRALAAVAADPHGARLESGMRLLRVLGHVPGVAAIAGLATHEAHYVRWSAIRYAMGLDPEVAMPLLEAARSDPHPHVRAAAERALARFAVEDSDAAR